MNKTAVRNFAVSARIMLMNAVTQKAFEYGITEDNINDSVQHKVFTEDEEIQRVQLIQKIQKTGFIQTIEEIACIWFSRFIALRFMEVNQYLPSHIRIFTDKNGTFHPEILSHALDAKIQGLDYHYISELNKQQNYEKLYKYLIIAQCNAFNAELPNFFEKTEGWMELLFPENLLQADSVLALMVSLIPEHDWKQVQIIGWLYQYYHSELKNKIFSDLRKNIKISSENISIATQLFTPEWIVRYLVENSLGRLWIEGHEDSEIRNNFTYYLDETEQIETVKFELEKIRQEYQKIQPEQIKIIDPCMGTGHILIYAFDVMMKIYISCGYSKKNASWLILNHNLYGLDIDRFAYQLAYFSLMMKAREYNEEIFSCENYLHLANFSDVAVKDSSNAFVAQFCDADTYGSLMNVTAPENSENIPEFQKMLEIYHMMNQKYDVVITNPPYMGNANMNPKLSSFIKKNFPNSKADLFACFIEKCGQLTKPNGFYAMITMQSWMFLLSFSKLRIHLLQHDIINLIHLGANAFSQGDVGTIVQASAFVIRCSNLSKYQSNYINLCEAGSSEEKRKLFLNPKKNYFVSKETFQQIPSCIYDYWISEKSLQLFSGQKLGSFAEPRQGMTTSDNNKFVKKWHEVNAETICFHAENSEIARNSRKKWFPYNKGGGYRKWYGNHEYVVNYQDDGKELKIFHEILNQTSSGGRIKNKEYYFRKSVTWSFIALIPAFRYCPEGFIFDVAGSSLFVEDALMNYMLALLCSCVTRHFLNLMNPTMNIQTNDIKSLPYLYEERKEIEELVSENISLCQEDWNSFETSWEFEQHPLV